MYLYPNKSLLIWIPIVKSRPLVCIAIDLTMEEESRMNKIVLFSVHGWEWEALLNSSDLVVCGEVGGVLHQNVIPISKKTEVRYSEPWTVFDEMLNYLGLHPWWLVAAEATNVIVMVLLGLILSCLSTLMCNLGAWAGNNIDFGENKNLRVLLRGTQLQAFCSSGMSGTSKDCFTSFTNS